MIIELAKFGTTLTSRQFGKEAFLAFSPTLNDIKNNESVEIDFKGVNTFAPSWADEFLTPLQEKYGHRLILDASNNPSVNSAIEIIEQTNNIKFIIKK